MISMIQEQEKIIFFSRKRKYEMKYKILNGNSILNYVNKRVILRYKVPLSWYDH